MNNRKRRKKLSVYSVKNSPITIVTLCAGIISFVVLLALCIVSAVYKGDYGVVAGIIPLIMLVVNIICFASAYRQLYKENIREGMVSLSAIINGGMVVIYLVLYLVGFYLIFR